MTTETRLVPISEAQAARCPADVMRAWDAAAPDAVEVASAGLREIRDDHSFTALSMPGSVSAAPAETPMSGDALFWKLTRESVDVIKASCALELRMKNADK